MPSPLHRFRATCRCSSSGDAKKGARRLRTLSEFSKSSAKRRPKPPTDPDEAAQKQDLFPDWLDTSLQGTKILEDRKLEARVTADIEQFIVLRLVAKKYPWAMRKSPLGGE